jgi:hypothetical protein
VRGRLLADDLRDDALADDAPLAPARERLDVALDRLDVLRDLLLAALDRLEPALRVDPLLLPRELVLELLLLLLLRPDLDGIPTPPRLFVAMFGHVQQDASHSTIAFIHDQPVAPRPCARRQPAQVQSAGRDQSVRVPSEWRLAGVGPDRLDNTPPPAQSAAE